MAKRQKLSIRSTSTANPKLAAALSAIGIPLYTTKPLSKISTTGDTPNTYVWNFQSQSANGKYKTHELIAAWENPNFIDENPDHPFSYIKCAFSNHKYCLDLVKKQVTLGVVEHRGKFAMIPTHLTQKDSDVYLARLEGKKVPFVKSS